MTERGQTASDYVIGMSLLLVTILGVFGAVQGGVYEPFEDPVDGDEYTMADELAANLVAEHRTMWGRQTVDNGSLAATLTQQPRFASALQRAGIPTDRRQVNVTVVNESGLVYSSSHDDVWRDRPSATAVRVIQTPNADECADSCQLVVRVWTR